MTRFNEMGKTADSSRCQRDSLKIGTYAMSVFNTVATEQLAIDYRLTKIDFKTTIKRHTFIATSRKVLYVSYECWSL